jgi:L,D-peptidoglycan transpeptidase YkuD (ErfK/YbiS/YcfS/YnhG family)
MPSPIALIVTPDSETPQRGTLRCGDHIFPCVLGRSGINTHKHEGDGATPVGRFPLRRVLYRADRLTPPETKLSVAAIARDDGWCDDPGNARYNRPVTLPYATSAEAMWRDDHLYDVVVILGHNDDPVVPGAGSAIFLHVASDHEPTAGCVALRRDDLLAVLRIAGPGSVIDIREGI